MSNYLTPEVLQQLLPYKRRSLEIARLLFNAGLKKQGYMVERCVDTSYCTESGFLAHANFCHNKFCPVCSFKRSREFQARSFPIFRKLASEGYKFLSITLTLPNCLGEDLRDTLMKAGKSFTELVRRPSGNRKGYGDVLLGTFRSYEVTYNPDDGTYHPHVHALAVVPSDYGPDGSFVDVVKFRQDWTKLLTGSSTYLTEDGIEASYSCWFRFVRFNKSDVKDRSVECSLGSAVCEVAKYPLKPVDLDRIDDFAQKVDFIKTLWEQTFKLRMYAFGGLLHKLDVEFRDSDNCDNIFILYSLVNGKEASREDLILHRLKFVDNVFLPDVYFGYGKFCRCEFRDVTSLLYYLKSLYKDPMAFPVYGYRWV